MTKTIALSILAAVFAALLVAERLASRETRSALATANEKLAAAEQTRMAQDADFQQVHQALERQRSTHDIYVTNTDRRINELEAALAAAKSETDTGTEKHQARQKEQRFIDEAKFKWQEAIAKAVAGKGELAEQQRIWARKAIDQNYAPLFAKLGLNDEQIEPLKGLLVEQHIQKQGAGFGNILQILDPNAPQKTDENAKTTEAIRLLLGEDGFTQLEQYQETLPQRATVNHFVLKQAKRKTPITDEQAEALITILHDAQAVAGEAAAPKIVQQTDDGKTVITVDTGTVVTQNEAKQDVIMKQIADKGILDAAQQADFRKQLQRDPVTMTRTFTGGFTTTTTTTTTIGGGEGDVKIQLNTIQTQKEEQ